MNNSSGHSAINKASLQLSLALPSAEPVPSNESKSANLFHITAFEKPQEQFRDISQSNGSIYQPEAHQPEVHQSRIQQSKNQWPFWHFCLAFSITVVFIGFYFSLKQTATNQPVNFQQPYNISPINSSQSDQQLSTVPLINRNTLDFNLPAPGTIIQVGIYSQLGGAEHQQREISKLGITPFIEKTRTGNRYLYAVVLGPFEDLSLQRYATASLRAADIDYFMRQEKK
ncbi:MAG: SPOR domain-containing protein [Pseudomonadales bacterium]|nr:SPOR domain-containing protein [Pseudomonadales bacterium]